MGGRSNAGHCPRFTFWLTFFQSDMLPLFFSGLLSYLVGIKRRTNRHVTCKRDNSHSLLCTYLPQSQNLVQAITPILFEVVIIFGCQIGVLYARRTTLVLYFFLIISPEQIFKPNSCAPHNI